MISDSGAFVARLGTDTVTVERFVYTGDRLTGEQLLTTPLPIIRKYDASFAANGAVTGWTVDARRAGTPATAAPLAHSTVTIAGDSATVVIQQGDSVKTRRVALASNVLPFLFPSYGPIEVAVMRARRMKSDSMPLTVFSASMPASQPAWVRSGKDDMLDIGTPFGLLHARADASGRVSYVDGIGTTQQFIVTRVPTADIAAVAASFAARRATGQLSPTDSAKAAIGGANMLVVYSRPTKRGRLIFGPAEKQAVVPWGQVWRTGANSATMFTTDKDLVIGGTPVPAGSYTLWTLPSPSGWQLIVNKQTKQWGTQYDPKQDLARIDMKTETLVPPAESMTIALVPQGTGGAIQVMWDDIRAWVPVMVKP
ncbi:MAG: DUF2911 domain-containing protein [Gemmatimonadota bacterium]|nr:DUF2911 domain-containing protein [Gemmatimonadota bacterium]